MTQSESDPIKDLHERLSKLEAEVKRIKRIEYKLLEQGMKSGSSGVLGAFILIPLMFFTNSAIFYFTGGKEFMSPAYLVGLAGILAFTLLAYFGFIFGYSTKISADIRERKFDAGTESIRP